MGSRSGFTLVEIVVSLAILAAVASGIAVAFRMTARSMERGEAAVHASVRQRARFALLERSFRGATPVPLPGDQGPAPWFRGDRERVSFLSDVPAGPEAGGLRLLTFLEGRLPSGERGLLMAGRSPFPASGDVRNEGDGEARLVFPGASGVSFVYVSGFSAAGAMETEAAWDVRDRKRLPVAVGIEFSLEGESSRRRIIVPIPAGVSQLPDRRAPFDSGPVG